MKNQSFNFNSQNGFTLVEMVLAVVIFLFLLVGVLRVTAYLYSSEISYSENAETGEALGQFETLFADDMEHAGWNLSQEPLPNLSGDNSVGILPHPDFSVLGSGSFNRTGQTSTSPAVLGYIVKSNAPAQIAFRPEASMYLGWRSIADPAQNRFLTINPSSQTAVVYENGQQQDTSSYGAYNYQTGDTFQIRLDSVLIGQNTVCVVSYYYLRGGGSAKLFFRSQNSCPAFPAEVFFDVAAQTKVTGVTLNAPLLSPHPLQAVDTKLAKLPVYGTAQAPDVPVFTDAKGHLVILHGDADFDRIQTKNPVTVDSTQSSYTFAVDKTTRGAISEGDYLLLIDYDSNHSVVLRANSYTAQNSAETATVNAAQIASSSTAAWGNLWTDFSVTSSMTFPARSSLIKLSAPVQWKLDTTNQSLFRREGKAWTLAAVGVQNFAVVPIKERNQLGYEMSVTLKNDGRETDAPAGGLVLKKTFYPRFLNRTANASY